jgi:hypothetical protein
MNRQPILLVVLTLAGAIILGQVSIGRAEVSELKAGSWSGGGALGFLGNTPDKGYDFALKGHADYFVSNSFSVGPLAQYAGAGSDFLFGLSLQAKYWWNIPGYENRARLVMQGGIGFAKAGIGGTEVQAPNGTPITAGQLSTSFFIPLGVGVDYVVTNTMAVTADFLLNFTDLGNNAAWR